MKKNLLFLIFASIALLGNTFAQTPYKTVTKKSADGKFTYTEVEGDPAHVRTYTLANGLTVIMSENHLEPKVMTLFTTKAGSKNDPPTHTGLAHYLEHMLFKGTDRYGSLDYAKEKEQLDRIENLYEDYLSTKDEVKRKAIYHRIDSVSGVAAKFAIANEYDKMMSAIGSNVTNAFTSFENTTYLENIPSNNMEKYLEVQAERMRNPVLRLFHTELEAVYEEKNIGMDNGDNKIFEAMFSNLFKKHPYGTQTTIGTIEHLKNPSLKEIRKYFDKYYIPNNMALILCGDLKPDEMIAQVDKYFGTWVSKPLAPFTFEKEEPRTKSEEITVMSPDEERVAIGFLMPNANDKESVLADLVSSILYNGKSGLIDKNLVKGQKILEGYGFSYLMSDYGIVFFQGKPLQGQGLSTVKDLFLKEIERLKKGDFDGDLIAATVNNLKVGRVREQENAMYNGYSLNNQYSVGQSREDYLKGLDMMSQITKADVVAFANKWFGDNYTVVYKNTGEDKNVQKVVKPEIHPVEVNRDATTDFCKRIIETPTTPLRPVFIDYDKDILKKDIKKDLPLWYVPNKINGLFSAYYVLDMGQLNNKKLPLAIDYLQLIGTNKMTNEQFNKELYKLAVDMKIKSSEDQVSISLEGLEENFDKALALLEDLLNNPKPDQAALSKMIEAKIKGREDALLNKETIFWEALDNYTSYGAKNPYNDVLSNADLRAIKASELTDIIRSLPTYKHKVYYYGPRDFNKVANTLKAKHKTPSTLKDYPKAVEYKRNESKENTVFFVNYDMVQAEVVMQNWDKKFDTKEIAKVRAFNEYYGGNMSSVVFQEIRESKALAYGTFAAYSLPQKREDPFKAFFYVGTQADKLPEAMKAINVLLTDMPQSQKMWDNSKRAIKTGIESNRITKSQILFNYQYDLRLGFDHDRRKDIYGQIDAIGLKDIEQFHKENMKSKPWQIRVLANKDKINIEDLKKYGKVVELNLKDVFGYEVEPKVIKP